MDDITITLNAQIPYGNDEPGIVRNIPVTFSVNDILNWIKDDRNVETVVEVRNAIQHAYKLYCDFYGIKGD